MEKNKEKYGGEKIKPEIKKLRLHIYSYKNFHAE